MGAERLNGGLPGPTAAPSTGATEARAALEPVVRASHGRLLAILATGTGDIALAEDVLGDAYERALRIWPGSGVPRRPAAWLLTVARNRQRDVLRSSARRTNVPLEAAAEPADPGAVEPDLDAVGDRRLELMLVCTHPAIDPAVRTPLILQTVLGLDARDVATAFAVPTAAMAQRLVRAKRRIRDTRIPFRVPAPEELTERLPALLEALYGAFAVGRSAGGADGTTLAGEARELALLLAARIPEDPEALGLAALLSMSLARGLPSAEEFVPLDEQDAGDWEPALVAEGEALLRRAQHVSTTPGRFELEAAIQAVHCDRAQTGRTDLSALRTLYRALVVISPSVGARVALAAVLGRTDGAAVGIAELDALAAGAGSRGPDVEAFQPYHAVRAALLAEAGDAGAAEAAYARAAELTDHGPAREHLLRRAVLGSVSGG